MVDVVKYEKLDLLHVHYAIPHASAAFMAKQILKSQGINIPFVTTLHGTDITLVGKDPSFEPVITFCINESDAVTAVSESLKSDTYTHFNTQREIFVVPNFIAPNIHPVSASVEVRKKYATDEQRILCHVSNFRKVKRVDDVVRIFSIVQKQINAKLILAGDGPERYAIERLVRELSLCENVLFLGKVRDTSHVLELADVFLLPSETESFGLAALEAMAVGVPVISSNTGGIPEVNTHGVTGFLSNVGDVEDMAANALKILTDDAILSEFKSNAVKRSHDFDLEKILPMYERIYHTVCSRY
jgi:N-acetyl-alpha-D-glucosaminyl L-malate synthase BshA